MTYRYVAYDIQKSLKKNFDDADTRLPQIIYWIQVIANALRVVHFNEMNTDMFLSTFYPVTVEVDDKGRQYIDLPGKILDLQNDKGIVYITYNHETCCCKGPAWANTFFQPTKVSNAHRLYKDEYERPTTQKPYFYRIGESINSIRVNRVYFLGTECIKLKDVEIGLLMAIDPTKTCSLDEEVPLPDELISELITEVLQLGRFVTFMPEERANTGGDEAQAMVNNVPSVQTQSQQEEQQQQ